VAVAEPGDAPEQAAASAAERAAGAALEWLWVAVVVAWYFYFVRTQLQE
jgi:hypothetical protein